MRMAGIEHQATGTQSSHTHEHALLPDLRLDDLQQGSVLSGKEVGAAKKSVAEATKAFDVATDWAEKAQSALAAAKTAVEELKQEIENARQQCKVADQRVDVKRAEVDDADQMFVAGTKAEKDARETLKAIDEKLQLFHREQSHAGHREDLGSGNAQERTSATAELLRLQEERAMAFESLQSCIAVKESAMRWLENSETALNTAVKARNEDVRYLESREGALKDAVAERDKCADWFKSREAKRLEALQVREIAQACVKLRSFYARAKDFSQITKEAATRQRTMIAKALGSSCSNWHCSLKACIEGQLKSTGLNKEETFLGAVFAGPGQGKTHLCREFCATAEGILGIHLTLSQDTTFGVYPEIDRLQESAPLSFLLFRLLKVLQPGYWEPKDAILLLSRYRFEDVVRHIVVTANLPLVLFVDEFCKVTDPILRRETLNYLSSMLQSFQLQRCPIALVIAGIDVTPTAEILLTGSQRYLVPIQVHYCSESDLTEIADRLFFSQACGLLALEKAQPNHAMPASPKLVGWLNQVLNEPKSTRKDCKPWLLRKFYYAAVACVGRHFRTLQWAADYLSASMARDEFFRVVNERLNLNEEERALFPAALRSVLGISNAANIEPWVVPVDAQGPRKPMLPAGADLTSETLESLIDHCVDLQGTSPSDAALHEALQLYLRLLTNPSMVVNESEIKHLLQLGLVSVKERQRNIKEVVPRVNPPALFQWIRERVGNGNATPVEVALHGLVTALYTPQRSSETLEAMWPYLDWIMQFLHASPPTSDTALWWAETLGSEKCFIHRPRSFPDAKLHVERSRCNAPAKCIHRGAESDQTKVAEIMLRSSSDPNSEWYMWQDGSVASFKGIQCGARHLIALESHDSSIQVAVAGMQATVEQQPDWRTAINKFVDCATNPLRPSYLIMVTCADEFPNETDIDSACANHVGLVVLKRSTLLELLGPFGGHSVLRDMQWRQTTSQSTARVKADPEVGCVNSEEGSGKDCQ